MSLALKYQAVSAIRHSYRVLAEQVDLSPENAEVTQTLTHLVRTLTSCQSPRLSRYLMQTPELATERAQLPGLCGMAECEMEKFWARRLLTRADAHLSDFWYLAEYRELFMAEKGLFEGNRRFDNISFLGAGALPLTGFLLAGYFPQAKITCVDFDAEACDLSRALCRKIGLHGQVDVRQMDALDYRPQDGELVICASLLQGREQVYRNLENHDCALIVRDAEGAYQYLYKAAELPARRFREIAKTSVDSRRINTSRYYERSIAHAA